MGEVVVLPAVLERDAIGRAHHLYYALKRGQTCGELDDYDRDYVDTLARILALVEPSAGNPD